MTDYISQKVSQIESLNKRFGPLIDPKLVQTDRPKRNVANIIKIACSLQSSIEKFIAKNNREPHLAPLSGTSIEVMLNDLENQIQTEAFVANHGYGLSISVLPGSKKRIITISDEDGVKLASAEFAAPPGAEALVTFDDGENISMDEWMPVYQLDPYCSETIHCENGVVLEDNPSLTALWKQISELRFIEPWDDLPDVDIAEANGKKMHSIDDLSSSFIMNYIDKNKTAAKQIAIEVGGLKDSQKYNNYTPSEATEFSL